MRAAHQGHSQKQLAQPVISGSAPPKVSNGAAGSRTDGYPIEQHYQNISNYKDAESVRVAVPYEPVTSINAVANATSNSEESSFYIQNQKKSLEVITERQSEFSNTMGTFARPS